MSIEKSKKSKKKRLWVFEERTGKWKSVSIHNPNYEWKNGYFVRKPCK